MVRPNGSGLASELSRKSYDSEHDGAYVHLHDRPHGIGCPHVPTSADPDGGGFLTLLLGVVGAVLPVPYVVLSPGPTENTIGDVKGEPVISIEGRETYPTSGKLSLVTVAYQGGPGNRIDLFSALRGWVDPTVAVVPEETIFPPTSTAEEVDQQNIQEMTNSQDDATAAALSELKIPYTAVVSVASVQKGFPADGKFRAGDEIVSIDGVRVIDRETVSSAVRKHKAGQKVTFAVKRAGQSTTLTVPTRAAEDGTPIVGITMQIKYRFPFKVKINVGDVGGPSAGMMFSSASWTSSPRAR